MNAKEKREFELENGICTTCHKAIAVKGHTSCLSCLDDFKIIYERRRARGNLWHQRHRKELNATHRVKYAYMKEHGLCVVCGRKTDGKVRCTRCNAKNNEKQRRIYAKLRGQGS